MTVILRKYEGIIIIDSKYIKHIQNILIVQYQVDLTRQSRGFNKRKILFQDHSRQRSPNSFLG